MKTYVVAGAITFILLGSALAVFPLTGWCLGCIWSGACYSDSICGSGCICVKRSTTDTSGFYAVY